MEKEKKSARERHIIAVGPLLYELIQRQREIIKEATYGVSKSSNWEAGEVIAKKMVDEF